MLISLITWDMRCPRPSQTKPPSFPHLGGPLWSSTSTIEPKGSWNDPTVWFFTWRWFWAIFFFQLREGVIFSVDLWQKLELKIWNLFSLDFMEVKRPCVWPLVPKQPKNIRTKKVPKNEFCGHLGRFWLILIAFCPPFSVLELMVWEASNCPWTVTFWTGSEFSPCRKSNSYTRVTLPETKTNTWNMGFLFGGRDLLVGAMFFFFGSVLTIIQGLERSRVERTSSQWYFLDYLRMGPKAGPISINGNVMSWESKGTLS